MMSHDGGDASRDQLDVAKLESLARDSDVPVMAPVSALIAVRQAVSVFAKGGGHQPSALFFGIQDKVGDGKASTLESLSPRLTRCSRGAALKVKGVVSGDPLASGGKKKRNHGTQDSRVVPHRGTN